MALEEAGAVETRRQEILGAFDAEFLVARAHEGLSRPLAAAVVIECIDVIIAGDQRAAQQRLAAPRGHVPPALGGPALGVLIAERDADPACRIVAETKVSRRRTVPQARQGERQRRYQAGAQGTRGTVGAMGIFGDHSAKLYQLVDDFA